MGAHRKRTPRLGRRARLWWTVLASGALFALFTGGARVKAVSPVYNIRIYGANVLRGQPVPIRVVSRAGIPLRVQQQIGVERWEKGHWVPLSPAALYLYLRKDCKPDPKTRVINPPRLRNSCITIPPGTFRAPAWFGTHGHAQCACDKCYRVAPGRYRYVVRYCGSKRRIISMPFRIR